MKWTSIETGFFCTVLAATATALALSGGQGDSSLRGFTALFDGRAADDNPGSYYSLAISTARRAEGGESGSGLAFEGSMPDLNTGGAWINSVPLSTKSLHGSVVLITFWTYTCINSLRTLPYVEAWSAKYKNSGLVVIGVHTPEFSFEREQQNVEIATREHMVTYPVVMDNNYEIWRSFSNEAWPAFYLVDAKGRIRYHQFGEGDYGKMEYAIQALLKERGAQLTDPRIEDIIGRGIEAPPGADERSPESYIGYRLSERFVSPGGLKENREKTYNTPERLALNQWGLIGPWKVNSESAVLVSAPGKIAFRFHSRDLHLVMAPSKDGSPVRFKVTLDGASPGDDCGVDSAPDGTGVVREPRLYQLVRQKGTVKDRIFEIEFLDPGVQALDFTFG